MIFEGITDQDALGQIFDEYFSTQNVRVALTHGDLLETHLFQYVKTTNLHGILLNKETIRYVDILI